MGKDQLPKKTNIIYTWGTFLSQVWDNWIIVWEWETKNVDKLQKATQELKKTFDFDETQLYSIDSSDLLPENLEMLKKYIKEKETTGEYSDYLIVHGTDTLEFTASYLSLIFPDLFKNITLTWSMISVNEEGSDALSNLLKSLVISQQDFVGTSVVFDKKWMQWNKVSKQKTDSFSAFDTVWYKKLYTISSENISWDLQKKEGYIDFGGKRYNFSKNKVLLEKLFKYLQKKRIEKKYELSDLNTNIDIVELYPWYNYNRLDEFLDKRVEWLIIKWYWDWNVPQHKKLLDKIDQLREQKTLMVLETQVPNGKLLHQYSWAKTFLEKGVVSAGNLSHGTTRMKLMLALWQKQGSRSSDIWHIKDVFVHDYAWENL